MFAEIVVSIGLNDKSTKKQEIATETARKIVFKTFGDCTIQDCRGRYTHESGEVVIEKSFRVTIYADTSELENITEKCKELKVKLNQESIVLSWRPVGETSFI